MAHLKWGVLGAGNIAKAFATGVARSKTGTVTAVGSRDIAKAQAFAEPFDIPRSHGSYEALIADSEVDAIYIATPHPMHAEWAIRCADAGKHVLCEKPLTVNAFEAEAVIEAAHRNDVFIMEAFMYRCTAQTRRLVELIREGVIGEVRMIRASFGFCAGENLEGRLLSNALAGGGILDVGCYATSMARLIAGAALGFDGPAEPIDVSGSGRLHPTTGVDEVAIGTLRFDGDILAQISTSVRLNQDNTVQIFGLEGSIVVHQPWFCQGREGGESRISIHRNGEDPRDEVIVSDEHLYTGEADAAAASIDARAASFPAMSPEDTLGNMRTLDRWREAIGLRYEAEQDANLVTPVRGGALSRRADAPIKQAALPGLEKPVSRLVMGVDNQRDLRQASALFDDFFELGGNAFDSAHIYGNCEQVLGQWMANRGVRDQVVVLTKGAHTPHCDPESITSQLMTSLERLQTEQIDIYCMHRDNPEIPVGEFVDVMHEHAEAGRIKVFGGSNWTTARVDEANAYARANGKREFGVVSNNFSLAEMIDPIWAGSVQTADPDSRAWFTERQMPLLVWSSQARGFFVDGRAHPDKQGDKEMVRCWYSDANFERLRRARELAGKRGCSAINIAAAYVLEQPFPTWCLIGPRRLRETWTSSPACDVTLSPDELRWLNLED